MRIVARLLAILLMGAVLLALIALPIAMGAVGSALGAGAKDPPIFGILAPFLAVAALVFWIGVRAPTARIAWGRLIAVAAIGAFALPLEGLIGTALLGSNLVSNVTSPGVNTAAARRAEARPHRVARDILDQRKPRRRRTDAAAQTVRLR